MRKFESTHSVLEVVSWTKFQPVFLNRQIITLLTSLGVSEEVFWQMQDEMICNLDRILSDRNIAFQIAVSPHRGLLAAALHTGLLHCRRCRSPPLPPPCSTPRASAPALHHAQFPSASPSLVSLPPHRGYLGM
jgi:hypothetical protein